MKGKLLGPYRLDSELGTGGMGRVWLATVVSDSAPVPAGSRVAVKVVHPHLLERPGFFERFVREVRAGELIRHENVVRVLDAAAAEHDGAAAHFLAMEYVAGRTLRRLVDDLDTVPEALLREIALQIAHGLEAVHEAGIIHRDLKPENVLLTDDHRVRIMDLGVARLMEESATLTVEGEFAGSLYYAAPEQYRGEKIGPAADLYSLGVLLYEMAVGHHPFRRATVGEVIAAHLHETPSPALERNPRVSAFLSEVLDALLVKDPAARIGSATDLRRILESGEGSRWWTERARGRPGRRRLGPRIPVRRETRLRGREKEIDILRDAWQRARIGDGHVVLIEGEAGIGKSRLVDAVLDEIPRDGESVLYGSYPPSGGLGGISDALLDHFGADGLEETIRPHLAAVPSVAPAFAALVRHESPPEGHAPSHGAVLHAALCHLMRSLAAERPLLWIIEDLHFAQEDSRKLIQTLARAVEGQPVLLVLTTRQSDASFETADLARRPGFRKLVLGRLGARQVIEVLRDAFGSEHLAERLGGKIAYKSDGVPFFVLELIRGLQEGGLIRRLPDGTWAEARTIDEIEVPSAVRDLIGARLAELSEEDRGLLDMAAVQGFRIDPDLLGRVRGVKRVVVLERLAALERRTCIVQGDGDAFRFDHHQIQEVLYADLHESLRAEYHTATARGFHERETARGSAPEGEAACFLAHHHLLGARPERALDQLGPALRHLGRCYRNDEALDLARRALAHPDLLDGGARIAVLLECAARLSLLGRRDEESAALEEALHLADANGDPVERARVRTALGYHCHGVARYQDAADHLTAAVDLAREAGAREREGEASRGLGAVLWVLGRREDARRFRERALTIARETGDRQAEAKATGNLGNLEFYLDRLPEARRHYERELSIAREIGDRRSEGMAVGSVGMVDSALGDLRSASEHLEQSLAIARDIGDRQGESAAAGNLATVHSRRGDLAGALDLRERQLAIAREIGERCFEGIALTSLGGLHVDTGDHVRARRCLEDARDVLTEIGARRPLAEAERALGDLAAELGRPDRARDHYERSLAICRDMGHPRGIVESQLSAGRLQIREGLRKDARERLDEVRALAGELRLSGPAVLAAAHLAHLDSGAAGPVEALLDEHGPRLGLAERMEAHFVLWRIGRSTEHLRTARRLLDEIRDGAPADRRDATMASVGLHRDIAEAWEAVRSRGPSVS